MAPIQIFKLFLAIPYSFITITIYIHKVSGIFSTHFNFKNELCLAIQVVLYMYTIPMYVCVFFILPITCHVAILRNSQSNLKITRQYFQNVI